MRLHGYPAFRSLLFAALALCACRRTDPNLTAKQESSPPISSPVPSPSPDPLVSGRHLSAWIMVLDDRDPEMELLALQAITKLEHAAPEWPVEAAISRPVATEAEAARGPLKAVSLRTSDERVTLAAQYALWTLFGEVDPAYTPAALRALASPKDDVTKQATALLQQYPSKADAIVDAALVLCTTPKVPQQWILNGALLLTHYADAAWPKLRRVPPTGTAQDKMLYLLRHQVVVCTKHQPSQDWPKLAAQAQDACNRWHQRVKDSLLPILQRKINTPEKGVVIYTDPEELLPAGATAEEQFLIYDEQGREWRRVAEADEAALAGH